MSHCLRALVAENPVARMICERHPAMFMVGLQVPRLSLLPFSYKVESAMTSALPSGEAVDERLLPEWAIEIGKEFSRHGVVAFIATEISSNLGGQACCVWRDGEEIVGPFQDIELDIPMSDDPLEWAEYNAFKSEGGYFEGVPFRPHRSGLEEYYVNAALECLGVNQAMESDLDAFDQCGLGRCRSSDDWEIVKMIDNYWEMDYREADAEESRIWQSMQDEDE